VFIARPRGEAEEVAPFAVRAVHLGMRLVTRVPSIAR
jgi:hypothetical protein